MTPKITDVKVEPYGDDDKYVVVRPVWSEVDRPDGSGWVVRPVVAQRLKKALFDGAIFTNIEVGTDIFGKTYVSSHSRVMAKYMNADLKKLGY